MIVNFKGFNDTSLCDKCEHGRIMITSKGRRKVHCSAIMQDVPPDIVECNEYQAKGTSNIYEMEKQAWILENKHGRAVGFNPPEPKKD